MLLRERPRLKYGNGADLQYRCENYAKSKVSAVLAAGKPYLYSLHPIRVEFVVDLHPNLLFGAPGISDGTHMTF